MTWSPVPSSLMVKLSFLPPPAGTVMPCLEPTSVSPSLMVMVMIAGLSPVLLMDTVTMTLPPSSTSLGSAVTTRLSSTAEGGWTKVTVVTISLLDVFDSRMSLSGAMRTRMGTSNGDWISVAPHCTSMTRCSPTPSGTTLAVAMTLLPRQTSRMVPSEALVPMLTTVMLMVTASPTRGSAGKNSTGSSSG